MEPTAHQPIVRKHVVRIRTSLGTVQVFSKHDTREEADAYMAGKTHEIVSITEEDVQLHF